MTIRASLLLVTLVAIGLPLCAEAQGFAPRTAAPEHAGIPRGFAPPPGMCRVWIDNVPAGKQPPPTDCASAIRNRPSNGRVVFGDDIRAKAPGKGDTGTAKAASGRKKP